MRLSKEQQLFAMRVPYLILMAHEMGYGVTGGDWHRSERCPYGSSKSKHHKRLAIDLNLFANPTETSSGEYLQLTSDHEPLGRWWQSIGGVWGGEFNDGNHYQAAKDPGDWIPIEDVAKLLFDVVTPEKPYYLTLVSTSPIKIAGVS